MTNQINNQRPNYLQPNYSGVTIQISNPAVNIPGSGYDINSSSNCQCNNCIRTNYSEGYSSNPIARGYVDKNQELMNSYAQAQEIKEIPSGNSNNYPPQYYLNNYNYQYGNGTNSTVNGMPQSEDKNGIAQANAAQDSNENSTSQTNIPQNSDRNGIAHASTPESGNNIETNEYAKTTDYSNSNGKNDELDLSKSNGIINDLDARSLAIKNEQKNTKNKRITALTDEYIKSLENYLDNPNKDIRLMAAKDILTRLDEDKDRYNDKALNALLNKMLQDPDKVIRVAALSAFSSELACGNDYTITLLNNIQNNPKADKDDVLQVADIKLKMSSSKENIQVPNNTNTTSVEIKSEQKG